MRIPPDDRSLNVPGGPIGTLFDPWPTAPAAKDEQQALSLPGTIQGRYDDWKRSEDGQRVMEAITVRALALGRMGEQRISSKRLVEEVRAALHREINNDFTALIARELNEYPELVGKIELRQRKAV